MGRGWSGLAAWGWVIALAVAVGTPAAGREPAVLAAFEEAARLMSEHYFDARFGGLDWERETSAVRRRILMTSDPAEQYAAVVELFGKLQHSHLEFVPPAPYGRSEGGAKTPLERGPAKEVDFRVAERGRQFVVREVRKGGASWGGGLRPGFVIQRVNGVPAGDLVGKQFRALELLEVLRRLPGYELRLEGVDDRERVRVLRLRLAPETRPWARLGHVSAPQEVEIRELSGGVVAIRFNLFLFPIVATVQEAIRKHRGAPGMILDLRENPGGIGLLAVAVAAECSTERFNLGTQVGRTMSLEFPVVPRPGAYDGPLAVLVNGSTVSTAEILARGLQAQGRAVVVGTPTAGQALPSVIVRLSDGSRFQYPVAGFRDRKGMSLEGIGVVPDVTVPLRLEDLRKGVDTQLAAALAQLEAARTKRENGAGTRPANSTEVER